MVFAIAIAGARDWTLVNNTLAGNQTFVSASRPVKTFFWSKGLI